MRKALYADVERHAVRTPWTEEEGRYCAVVCIKFQARKGDATYDIDTLKPSEDQDLAWELQELASLSMVRVRYLTRRKRDALLASEQQHEVKLALGRIADQMARIGKQMAPHGIDIWFAEPPDQGGDEPPAEHWAGSDPTTTPPH